MKIIENNKLLIFLILYPFIHGIWCEERFFCSSFEKEILRRIRQPAETSSESPLYIIPSAAMAKAFVFWGGAGFGETVTKINYNKNLIKPNTLLIGVFLGILKNHPGLGFSNLDIGQWFRLHSDDLRSAFGNGIETELSQEQLGEIERVRGELRTADTENFEKLLTKFYLWSDFISLRNLDVAGKTIEQIETEIFASESLLDYLDIQTKQPKVYPRSFSVESGLPGLYKFGEIKDVDKQEYKKAKREITEDLVRRELYNYRINYLTKRTYAKEISELKATISNLHGLALEERLKEHANAGHISQEALAELEEDLEKQDKLYFLDVRYKLLGQDIDNFLSKHLGFLEKKVELLLDFKNTSLFNSHSLFDSITYTEAEELARKVIYAYLEVANNSLGGSHYLLEETYEFENKHRNEMEGYKVRRVLEAIQKKEKELKQAEASPEAMEKFQMFALYVLLTRAMKAGVFDSSNALLEAMIAKGEVEQGMAELEKTIPIPINSFRKFYEEYVKGEPFIKFDVFLDNHGQIMWNLAFWQYLMQLNKDAYVVFIPRGKGVGDDVSYLSLRDILVKDETREQYKQPYYYPYIRSQLDNRFIIVRDGPRLQGIDGRRLSPEMIDALTRKTIGPKTYKIVYYFVGAANFNDTQNWDIRELIENVKIKKPDGTFEYDHKLINSPDEVMRIYETLVKYLSGQSATALPLIEPPRYYGVFGMVPFLYPGKRTPVRIGLGPGNVHTQRWEVAKGVFKTYPVAGYTFWDFKQEYPEFFLTVSFNASP